MDIPWHDFTDAEKDEPVSKASLKEKASVIGRVGMMFLSCGTGAWRVRSSMNTMSECMGLTCTADIGLMSINYTCFDGEACFSQSLCLTNTGVNNSKLTRLENFINDFVSRCDSLTCEQVHNELDDIEKIHGLYSPPVLGLAAALACVHIPAWRWTDRDDMCIFRCRHWQLCAEQIHKAPPYPCAWNSCLSIGGVPFICRAV